MKRFFLTFALAVFALAASAGETPKRPSCAGFVSNGFWDNWEISAGGGIGTAISNGSNMGKLGDRIGFEANFSVTKWVHPIAGLRLQLQGGQLISYDPTMGKVKWPYVFVHTDFMLNFSNWVGGYRDDRAYYAVPFFGFGYMASNITDSFQKDHNVGMSQNFAFSYGWLNKFRLSRSVDFNIELKGLLVPSRINVAKMNGSYLFGFSATAGFTYRFNKRDWQRGVSGYTAEDIQAFQDATAISMAAVEAAEIENARLAQQLAAAQAEADAAKKAAAAANAKAANATTVAEQETVLAETSIILFNYSMSTLTPQEKTRLELIANQIKSGSKDTVYQIVGHADQQTGTTAGNKRVAENRAKRVYDFLVSKGVNPKQLNYEGKGNSPDPYKKVQAANRAAIIK